MARPLLRRNFPFHFASCKLLALSRSRPHIRAGFHATIASRFTMSVAPKTASTAKQFTEPRPSASVILVSQTNQVLLLCRVKTSKSFASAHVFPGGNVDPRQDGELPPPQDPRRHEDSLVYRMSAVRECFEESGILLAKGSDGAMLQLDEGARERARKDIHNNKVRFVDWLAGIGGVADTDGLIPFTRWVTPHSVGRRFTTQMYIYMLPLGESPAERAMVIPTPDGGVEHTAAAFDDVRTWLKKQDDGQIVLFPPQYFLLHLLSQLLTPSPTAQAVLQDRRKLVDFLSRTPTAVSPNAVTKPTSQIPWTEKVMSPHVLFVRKSDKRVVLGVDGPGRELETSGRGGDWERVILVHLGKGVPTNLEVRNRGDVVREERETNGGEEPSGSYVMKL